MQQNKLNILIVCVSFPPLNFSGSSRPYNWAKNLSQYANIVVFTPKKSKHHGPLNYAVDHEEYKVVEYRGLIFNLIETLNDNILTKLMIKLHHLMWCMNVIFKSIKKNDEYDIVITTYGPWHSHFLGFVLKKFGIGKKWIADYRDSWNQNTHRVYRFKLFKKISILVEKFLLKQVNAITSVSEPLVGQLNRNLKLNEDIKFSCIYNGFEKLNNTKESVFSDKDEKSIILTHTGSIYKNHRDPSILFGAIANLIQSKMIDRSKLRIIFAGAYTANVMEIAEKYNIEETIELTGQIERNQSIALQQNSDFLILLNSGSEESKGIMTGKIFEYISSGVPILGIGFTNENVAGKLIHESKTGKTFTDSNSIEKVITEYINKKVVSWFDPDYKLIMEYQTEKQVDKLFNLIEQI